MTWSWCDCPLRCWTWGGARIGQCCCACWIEIFLFPRNWTETRWFPGSGEEKESFARAGSTTLTTVTSSFSSPDVPVRLSVSPTFPSDDKGASASDFYRASQLPNIELPRYAQYLLEQQRGDDARRFARAVGDVHLQEFADALMEDDEAFMRELRAGRIIRPSRCFGSHRA